MTNLTPCIHAIVPAAGHSRRMGQSKLLMEIGGVTLLERLLRQLKCPLLASVTVLVREDDLALQRIVQHCGVGVVQPCRPPAEMRHSIEYLLDDVRHRQSPAATDGWLLIPADHPVVEETVLERLVQIWMASPHYIIVPRHAGRRGHPTIFPWSLTEQIQHLPEDQGINWLLRHGPSTVCEVACPEPSVLYDIDTPEDFARIRCLLENGFKFTL